MYLVEHQANINHTATNNPHTHTYNYKSDVDNPLYNCISGVLSVGTEVVQNTSYAKKTIGVQLH